MGVILAPGLFEGLEHLEAPEHGGRLNATARRFNIPIAECIDLSTGINLNGWPVPSIPPEIFSRLPENDDALVSSAIHYYQVDNLLPVAGSQAAIQCLPMLRPYSRVGIINPAYQEHAYCWKKAGHDVQLLVAEDISAAIDQLDVLLIVNPNNPTGLKFSADQLMDWHARLNERNGWLIVDEAFMDASENDSMQTNSLLKFSQQRGLIVLRSLGKFFGLAGLRVGFVFAETQLIAKLANILGPWTLSNPSRFIANGALLDENWQIETRTNLAVQSKRLVSILTDHGLEPSGGTELFQWICHDKAHQIYHFLATHGIVVRYFKEPNSLRFGLPRDEGQWLKLSSTLSLMNLKMDAIFS